MITITDMNNNGNTAKATNPTIPFKYWDSHNGGAEDATPFGLWIQDNTDHSRFSQSFGITFAMDLGERVHCLNGMSWCDRRESMVLSTISIGGTYMVNGEKAFVDSHTFSCNWVGRLRFDTQKEIEDFLKSHAKKPFESVQEVLDYIASENGVYLYKGTA